MVRLSTKMKSRCARLQTGLEAVLILHSLGEKSAQVNVGERANIWARHMKLIWTMFFRKI